MTEMAHPNRVLHIPQVPGPAYVAPARSLQEAVAIFVNLAQQHLWMLDEGIIPDYSNVLTIQVWDGEEWEDLDEDSDVFEAAVADYEQFAEYVKESKA